LGFCIINLGALTSFFASSSSSSSAALAAADNGSASPFPPATGVHSQTQTKMNYCCVRHAEEVERWEGGRGRSEAAITKAKHPRQIRSHTHCPAQGINCPVVIDTRNPKQSVNGGAPKKTAGKENLRHGYCSCLCNHGVCQENYYNLLRLLPKPTQASVGTHAHTHPWPRKHGGYSDTCRDTSLNHFFSEGQIIASSTVKKCFFNYNLIYIYMYIYILYIYIFMYIYICVYIYNMYVYIICIYIICIYMYIYCICVYISQLKRESWVYFVFRVNLVTASMKTSNITVKHQPVFLRLCCKSN